MLANYLKQKSSALQPALLILILKNCKKFAKLHNNIRLFIDHENIAKLMNESNKLIISASSLVNEALLLKANFKAICYVKNQESTATWLAKKGYEVEYKY